MDEAFWHERWARHDIGFHQPHIHDQLRRLWPSHVLPSVGTVFVPLCGKSRDMVWLAELGHRVIGVERSAIAVREFFEDQGLVPVEAQGAHFRVSSAGPFTLYCGDIFNLCADHLREVTAVYDRAALIALPEEMRTRYAELLKRIVPTGAPIFLIAVDYPKHEISGPPFAVPAEEIDQLFGGAFEVAVLESRDGLAASDNLKKRGVTRLEETAYLLRRRA